MSDGAARTALGPIAMVAIEQGFPDNRRILDDDLAHRFLPLALRVLVWSARYDSMRNRRVRASEKSRPGVWSGVMCRKRYIDEKLCESIDDVGAIVNLGAGFDTRAYRLRAVAEMPIWEVDQPENVKQKRARLRKVFGAVPAHVRLVPSDLDREEPGAALAAHGYRAGERTFFIWEAVTQYLTESGVRATFELLARAARGSRLAFTYGRKDFVDGRALYGQEVRYEKTVVRDGLWRFGMEPKEVCHVLRTHGWRAIEHLGYEELAERYVRPTGRNLASTPLERMVYAEKS